MASVSKSIVINATPKECLAVITDYENYPEFLKEVSEVTIDKKSGSTLEVTFSINIIKSFSYTLKITTKGEKVSWTFVKGSFMKDNKGEWTLKDLGNKTTEATYSIDVSLGMLVPGSVSKVLIGNNLPSMLEAFKTRIESNSKKKKK